MLKVRFFIFWTFAALCFGDASLDDSSPGDKGFEAGGNSETVEGAETSSTTRTPIALLNSSIPDFVGNYERKRSLMSTLVANCKTKIEESTVPVESRTPTTDVTTEPPSSAVNLASVNFKNCTYICKPPNNGTRFMMHMPAGTVCDQRSKKCPESGPCPTPPSPAC
uniref:Putative ixodes 8-cys protein n=1 Tax=Ixodes ricinus TaxID=34613 RepID=A0A0K8RIX1_IXORI